MHILGIETSCDETAAAVLKSAPKHRVKILSSVVSSQIRLHAKTGGVVPEVAARAHIEKIIPVIDRALKIANITLKQIDAVAVTAGPGLITSLMVGVDTAKAIASALKLPLIAINHIEAHAFSPLLQNWKLSPFGRSAAGREIGNWKFLFPALALVVSGGHSDLIYIQSFSKIKKIGQSVDDAAGEAFDKIAKILNLGYPGGPLIAKLAEKGNPNAVKFPRPMINSDDFNFSFSGLKTAVLYYLRDNSPLPPLKLRGGEGALWKADIAASAQQAIVDVLVYKTLTAAKKLKVKTIMMGGGVASNKLLRDTLRLSAEKAGKNFLAAPKEYCTDNAAMIAFAGYIHAIRKDFTPLKKVVADPNWEL